MTDQSDPSAGEAFAWERQVEAAQVVGALIDCFCKHQPFAEQLKTQLLERTGTRLMDWVDHVAIPKGFVLDGQECESALIASGFRDARADSDGRWLTHAQGLFPAIAITDQDQIKQPDFRLAIAVESVADFLQAHQVDAEIIGASGSRFRKATVATQETALESFRSTSLFVCERRGWTRWQPCDATDEEIRLAREVFDGFLNRPRTSFEQARKLIDSATALIGVDWACDLFFAAEREYWQARNNAANIQRRRQDQLGLGWGNHDHHTYRNSRETFADLIACLEALGFHCRERFYAGGQAGWGAQVLEQSNTGVVIFADVDLSAEELAGDFSHDGLLPNEQLGTVGLWCHLHGEAFLQAGMHHLECQFDFDAARQQLAKEGINTMTPFTDFPHLRQAFTEGEVWPIDPTRIETAIANKFITPQQADTFRRQGAVGSHLEILQRNDGFKGFNQTGVSEIIRKTDPRTLMQDKTQSD